MADEQEKTEAESLRRELLFKRFWADSGRVINISKVIVIASTGEALPQDVMGVLMSALGRYVAMTSTIEGSGDEVFDKICQDGIRPMFVAMFEVQRAQDKSGDGA